MGPLRVFKRPPTPPSSRLTSDKRLLREWQGRTHTATVTESGVPFASLNALFNLSRLSVWWHRLGIEIERIKPGCPQQTAAMSACI